MKKINALLLVLVMVLSLLLSACSQTKLSGSAAYTVKVTDAKGTPYTSGVIVKFMKDGAQVAMQPVDANGTATKELERGDYTVELLFTDDNSGYFDPEKASSFKFGLKKYLELFERKALPVLNSIDNAMEMDAYEKNCLLNRSLKRYIGCDYTDIGRGCA